MAIGDSQRVEGLPGLEGITVGGWFDQKRRDAAAERAAAERAAAGTRRSVSLEETGSAYLPGLEHMVRFPGEGIDRYDPLKRLLRQETSDLVRPVRREPGRCTGLAVTGPALKTLARWRLRAFSARVLTL